VSPGVAGSARCGGGWRGFAWHGRCARGTGLRPTAHPTPSDPVKLHNKFYGWMQVGFQVFDAVASRYPRYHKGDGQWKQASDKGGATTTVTVKFDGSNFENSPDPVYVGVGASIRWTFRSNLRKHSRLRWIVDFTDKTPFGGRKSHFEIVANRRTRAVIGPLFVEYLGDYKYCVTVKDSKTGEILGYEDPELDTYISSVMSEFRDTFAASICNIIEEVLQGQKTPENTKFSLLASMTLSHGSATTPRPEPPTGRTWDTIQTALQEIKQNTAPLKGSIAKIENTMEIVREQVRGVPRLQTDLAEARIDPKSLALEIQNRIADTLTPEEQRIWLAVRAAGTQKGALKQVRKFGITSAATLNRRYRIITDKLKTIGLTPGDKSEPLTRAKESGGYPNNEGKNVPKDLSLNESHWTDDENERETTIRSYLAASPEDKAYFHLAKPGIKEEAEKHQKR